MFSIHNIKDVTPSDAKGLLAGLNNLNTGKIHFGAAKGYTPLNHEDALDPVLTAADHLGLNTLINIDNHHDVVEAFILFPDLMVNDHQDGIQMGVRFKK